ncbi:hypothetical protein CYLTODRAFT_420776 [Cylindrobasidium torrendii FP15055 ss-10]|uniref:Uncharacterized protein n=1 Tax=Cylindrobasidium torrendii FP15055 ss-10 TaxID=1314674 RepID=A0A0D7BFQ6_9AGAR|nr:hypothetical protein CYLTODRAFT_420776 [Cylindrobasidium torrendii FP15055 ss-10]
MSTNRLNHDCSDGSRLEAWISPSNDASQHLACSLSYPCRVSDSCISAQIDSDSCSPITRGKGHFFVRYVPPMDAGTPKYGLIVKYYQFGPKSGRPDGYQHSKAFRPSRASKVACYRFAGMRPNVIRLSAMVYRVKSAALGRVDTNNLDSLPESAYMDRFSHTHLRSECEPLLVFTFKISTPRSKTRSSRLSGTSLKEEESDLEIPSLTPGSSTERRERELVLKRTKCTRKRTGLDEDEGPSREKVKRVRLSHRDVASNKTPSSSSRAIPAERNDSSSTPSPVIKGRSRTKGSEMVENNCTPCEEHGSLEQSETSKARKPNSVLPRIDERTSLRVQSSSIPRVNAGATSGRPSLDQQLEQADQELNEKKKDIFRRHIRALEAQLEANKDEYEMLQRLLGQNAFEREENRRLTKELQTRCEKARISVMRT